VKNKILKKKISLKDWTYIGKFNHAAKWCRRICSYTLIKRDDKTFVREQKINLFAYLLIFIPLHILQAFVCMWDGGLIEFVILKRGLGQDYLTKGQASFERAMQIWDKAKANKVKEQNCL
jgi:hypothetical protein